MNGVSPLKAVLLAGGQERGLNRSPTNPELYRIRPAAVFCTLKMSRITAI